MRGREGGRERTREGDRVRNQGEGNDRGEKGKKK